jgi:hypothetical protein
MEEEGAGLVTVIVSLIEVFDQLWLNILHKRF